MITGEKLEKFNLKVRAVGEGALQLMKANAPRDSGKLAAGLQLKTKMEFGRISRLTFTFPRHGIFLEKGVGRGVDAKEAPGNRQAKLWYRPAIDQKLPELEAALNDFVADDIQFAINIGK